MELDGLRVGGCGRRAQGLRFLEGPGFRALDLGLGLRVKGFKVLRFRLKGLRFGLLGGWDLEYF